MDDWEVGDDDGDEGFAAGPEAAADCAVGAGLEGRCQSGVAGVWDSE